MNSWDFADEVERFEVELFLKQDVNKFLQQSHGIFGKAARNRKYKLVQTMIEHDPKRVLSRTKALEDAAINDDPYMIRLLVQHGANPKARRSVALRIAMRMRNERAAEALKECGAEIRPKKTCVLQ